MKRLIWEYSNDNMTVMVSSIDEDYMIETFGKMGKQMRLRLHEKNIIRMANAIMDDVMGVKEED